MKTKAKRKEERNQRPGEYDLDLQLEIVVNNSEELFRKERERNVINQNIVNNNQVVVHTPAKKSTVWH